MYGDVENYNPMIKFWYRTGSSYNRLTSFGLSVGRGATRWYPCFLPGVCAAVALGFLTGMGIVGNVMPSLLIMLPKEKA
jgi:hypothetical protein